MYYNMICSFHDKYCRHSSVGVWLSLVERLVRDQEAAGSNPVTPTINIMKGYRLSALHFFVLIPDDSNILQEFFIM